MKHLINKILKFLNLIIIYRDGFAYGEQLYMSALVNKLKEKKIILLTTCIDLFENNPDVYFLINLRQKNIAINLLIYLLNFLQGSNIILFYPLKSHNLNNKNYLNYYPYNKHVIEINSERSNVKFNKIDLKNFFYFSEIEEEELEKKFKSLGSFSLIQSETKDTFTNNKNWDVSKIQEIVNSFPKKNWVQIGLENDEKLRNIIDLRDKTSIRELAFLIKKSEFVVCLEGFFAHLSSCFNTRAYVIYSGIVPIENLVYDNVIPIDNTKNLKCSPCYKIKDCDLDKKYCTEDILASDVITKILKNESK